MGLTSSGNGKFVCMHISTPHPQPLALLEKKTLRLRPTLHPNHMPAQFEVVAPHAGGGLGEVVARGTLPVDFAWMASQVSSLTQGSRY